MLYTPSLLAVNTPVDALKSLLVSFTVVQPVIAFAVELIFLLAFSATICAATNDFVGVESKVPHLEPSEICKRPPDVLLYRIAPAPA